MKNYLNVISYIVVIVLTIIIVRNLGFAGGIDAENKIKALNHQIDSLQSYVDSTKIKITQLDSIATLYKTKVDEDKKKLSGLKAKADLYKNKYNEEHNRINKLPNAALVSEFTNTFD
jgi:predicted  nucleic acid-binding Zn-ribbon protein